MVQEVGEIARLLLVLVLDRQLTHQVVVERIQVPWADLYRLALELRLLEVTVVAMGNKRFIMEVVAVAQVELRDQEP